jgi:hypothetical protein
MHMRMVDTAPVNPFEDFAIQPPVVLATRDPLSRLAGLAHIVVPAEDGDLMLAANQNNAQENGTYECLDGLWERVSTARLISMSLYPRKPRNMPRVVFNHHIDLRRKAMVRDVHLKRGDYVLVTAQPDADLNGPYHVTEDAWLPAPFWYADSLWLELELMILWGVVDGRFRPVFHTLVGGEPIELLPRCRCTKFMLSWTQPMCEVCLRMTTHVVGRCACGRPYNMNTDKPMCEVCAHELP